MALVGCISVVHKPVSDDLVDHNSALGVGRNSVWVYDEVAVRVNVSGGGISEVLFCFV